MSSLNGETQWRDWSRLPLEMLDLTSHKVGEIGEYVRLGAVCKTWLSAAKKNPPQTPWLLLPYHPHDTLRRFRTLSPTGRVYTFDDPIFRWRIIFPSAYGWLLLTDLLLNVSLFNPITKAHICLPKVPTSSSEAEHIAGFASNIALLKNWSAIQISFKLFLFMSDAGELIVALRIAGRDFFYYRFQEEETAWIRPGKPDNSYIDCVVYHGERFYVIYYNGDVAVSELSPQAEFVVIPSLKVHRSYAAKYLVSLAGELLLVTYHHDIHDELRQCDCYRLNMQGQPSWSRIQDIGHHTLFLTLQNSILAPALGETTECKSNCMYICGDLESSSPTQTSYVVSVGDGSLDRIPELDVGCRVSEISSSWFVPTL